MLTKNTTHQYTQAETNRFLPEIDPELPTEFQIGTNSKRDTTSDATHEEQKDFNNFMATSFKIAASEQDLGKEPDFGLGRVLFYRI